MSEDWLDTGERVPALPAEVALPADYASRARLAEEAWSKLSTNQKVFLSAWRDCRYNARAANRQLGLSENTRSMTAWMHEPDFATVVQIWRANAAASALDKDRLLARHDDIVETALTPKPRFHQGIAMIDANGRPYEEVDVGGARAANADLMKAAGMLKDKDIEVNVGVVVGPPTLNIQVMPAPPSVAAVKESVVIDAKFTEVPADEDWLG